MFSWRFAFAAFICATAAWLFRADVSAVHKGKHFRTNKPFRVFNIEVHGSHAYRVSNLATYVHNVSKPTSSVRGPARVSQALINGRAGEIQHSIRSTPANQELLARFKEEFGPRGSRQNNDTLFDYLRETYDKPTEWQARLRQELAQQEGFPSENIFLFPREADTAWALAAFPLRPGGTYVYLTDQDGRPTPFIAVVNSASAFQSLRTVAHELAHAGALQGYRDLLERAVTEGFQRVREYEIISTAAEKTDTAFAQEVQKVIHEAYDNVPDEVKLLRAFEQDPTPPMDEEAVEPWRRKLREMVLPAQPFPGNAYSSESMLVQHILKLDEQKGREAVVAFRSGNREPLKALLGKRFEPMERVFRQWRNEQNLDDLPSVAADLALLSLKAPKGKWTSVDKKIAEAITVLHEAVINSGDRRTLSGIIAEARNRNINLPQQLRNALFAFVPVNQGKKKAAPMSREQLEAQLKRLIDRALGKSET